MTPGLPLTRCGDCGAGYFPSRLICAKCGGANWRDDTVHDGVVEQSTIVRHAAGRADWKPRHIATVRTVDGQLIIAGLEEPLPDMTRVKLFYDDGKAYALRSG